MPTLSHSLTHSLTYSISHPLSLSLSLSPLSPLSHCLTVSLSHCLTVSLCLYKFGYKDTKKSRQVGLPSGTATFPANRSNHATMYLLSIVISPSIPSGARLILPPSWHPSRHPSLPHSLTPSLPHSLTPSLPHSLTPSLPHSLTPSLPHSLTPSLPYSLSRSFSLRPVLTSKAYTCKKRFD